MLRVNQSKQIMTQIKMPCENKKSDFKELAKVQSGGARLNIGSLVLGDQGTLRCG